MSVFSKTTQLLPLKLFCLIPCLTLPLNASAESIQDWPSVNSFDLKPVKQRFIEAFENNPDNLDHLTQGFQTCSIDKKKLAKLSNINEDAIESAFSNNKDVKAKVKLNVKALTLASTMQGCEAFKKTKLEKIPSTYLKHYQVNAEFKYSFLIFSEYKKEITMQVKVDDKEIESKLDSHEMVHALYTVPTTPINPLYPKENYYITSTNSSYLNIKSYIVSLSPLSTTNDQLTSFDLSRTFNADKITNQVSIRKENENSKLEIQIIGNSTYMTLVDGKLDGLMITDNYSYATDKSQAPYMTSCYLKGERINVFKKIGSNACLEVGDKQIGDADVYVDFIYKIRLDANQKLAASNADNLRINQEEQDVNIAVANLANKNEEAQKAADAAFKKQQDEAQCSLKNQSWAYLGDNCLDGLADGEGSSIDKQGLKFIGSFKAGNRITGDIHQEGEMIFSGDFKQDKPDGGAICMFEGEYEECRFFRGKRIDTLYKIRKENAKNLAKMEQIQAEQQRNQQASSLQQQQNNNKQSNIVVDAIKKEGTKRAASFIFDQLF